jgi:hypothetical protein
MGAGITRSQSLAKVVSWLFIGLWVILTQQWVLLLLQKA